MKFCEVINDFAEHMTRLEQKLFLKRTDRAYQLSPNTVALATHTDRADPMDGIWATQGLKLYSSG